MTDLRVINGQRGKLVLFRLDDKSGTIEASVDENTYNQHRDTLKDDEMVMLQGLVKPPVLGRAALQNPASLGFAQRPLPLCQVPARGCERAQ